MWFSIFNCLVCSPICSSYRCRKKCSHIQRRIKIENVDVCHFQKRYNSYFDSMHTSKITSQFDFTRSTNWSLSIFFVFAQTVDEYSPNKKKVIGMLIQPNKMYRTNQIYWNLTLALNSDDWSILLQTLSLRYKEITYFVRPPSGCFL